MKRTGFTITLSLRPPSPQQQELTSEFTTAFSLPPLVVEVSRPGAPLNCGRGNAIFMLIARECKKTRRKSPQNTPYICWQVRAADGAIKRLVRAQRITLVLLLSKEHVWGGLLGKH